METSKRLVSLWDMLKFNAERFLALHGKITNIAGAIKAHEALRGFGDVFLIEEGPWLISIENVRSLSELCQSMSLYVTAKSVDRYMKKMIEIKEKNIKVMEKNGVPVNAIILTVGAPEYKEISTKAEQILELCSDEMASQLFLQLDGESARLYEQVNPLFGAEVASRFPGLIYDIEQSAKCRALGLSTAAVFHAVRCLEAGVAAVWRCLGISDPIAGYERNWGNRMKKIREQIEVRWPSSSGRLTIEAQFFDEIYAGLVGMQNPYRNSTMHLDKTYTEEDAKHIIDLVGAIMRKIASRIDEQGLQPV